MTDLAAAPAPVEGFHHEAVVVTSEEQFLDVAVPFVEAGLLAGEPVVTRLVPVRHRLVEAAVGRSVLTAPVADVDAPQALRAHRQLFEQLLSSGAPRVRVLGDDPVLDRPDVDAWGYYEVLSNRVYADLPVWSLCAHDVRVGTRRIEHDVRRSHPVLRSLAGGAGPNPDYVEPAVEQSHRTGAALREDQTRLPRVELVDPTAVEARSTVRDLVALVGISGETAEGLVMAASEIVDNAWVHGVPPVTLRAWTTPGRVVLAVSDTGPGPRDPLFELGRRPTGSGMRLAFLLCELGTWQDPLRGFTVRAEVRARAQAAE